MGLDNLPMNLPCEKQGTVIKITVPMYFDQPGSGPLLDDDGRPVERILCDETITAGGCPWHNANPPEEGRVYGMFGAPCWYRGKYGEALLEAAVIESENGFYGDNEDGTEKSPESCIALADAIDESLANGNSDLTSEDVDGLKYASWYLRWAADQADGLICWY